MMIIKGVFKNDGKKKVIKIRSENVAAAATKSFGGSFTLAQAVGMTAKILEKRSLFCGAVINDEDVTDITASPPCAGRGEKPI